VCFADQPRSEGRGDPYNVFEQVQEKDYEELFKCAKYSYYVTSYGDHNVWVLYDRSDINYYWENWEHNDKIKPTRFKNYVAKKTKPGTWRWGIADKLGLVKKIDDYVLMPGIYRIFVLEKQECDSWLGLNKRQKDKYVEYFVEGIRRLLKDENNPFGKFAEKLGIDDICPGRDNCPLTNEDNKVCALQINPDPKEGVLLAAKVHEQLEIGFCVKEREGMRSKAREYLLLDDSDCHPNWNDLTWKKLGSALIDDIVNAYASALDPEVLLYYCFRKDDSSLFAKTVLEIMECDQKFPMKFVRLSKDLDEIAIEVAKEITSYAK